MLALWMAWTACVAPSPRARLSDAGSSSSVPSSATADPLPEGWSRLRIARPGFRRITSDGTSTWALDGDLGLVSASTWQDLGIPTTGHGMSDADARDGLLWATGGDQLQWFDGATWSSVPLPEGMRNGAVVARGNGTIAVLDHFQGPSSAINTLGIWDGASWSVHELGPAESLYDLAETASGDLVAVGSGGWVARWDGAGWVDLFRSDPDALFAVAAHGDEIVAVGNGGLVVRGPISALSAERVGTTDLHAVDVGEDGTIWALGYDSAWVYDGDWTGVALPGDGTWEDIEATEDGAILVGDLTGPTALVGGIGGWNLAWRQPALHRVQDLWLEPAGTVWFGATLGIGRWQGEVFETWETPHPEREPQGDVLALSGSGPEDIVAVGQFGVMEWDRAAFTLAWPTGDAEVAWLVWDVSVAPDGTAFVAGKSRAGTPLLLRRDAGVWSVDPAPIPTPAESLFALQAFAADDVYALTWREPAALLHFDGVSWTELVPDLGEGHTILWGRSGTDLYIGRGRGEGPPLLHWDGTAATEVPGAPPYVTGLAGTDDALLVAGTEGWGDELAPLVTVWQDGTWTELARSEELLVVGALGDEVMWTDFSEVLRGPLSSWLSAR